MGDLEGQPLIFWVRFDSENTKERTKILTTGSLIIHLLPELLEIAFIPGRKKNEAD